MQEKQMLLRNVSQYAEHLFQVAFLFLLLEISFPSSILFQIVLFLAWNWPFCIFHLKSLWGSLNDGILSRWSFFVLRSIFSVQGFSVLLLSGHSAILFLLLLLTRQARGFSVLLISKLFLPPGAYHSIHNFYLSTKLMHNIFGWPSQGNG